MRMRSTFKLHSNINGIIHVIFLLILIYFNNGYVKMQLTEKGEKNVKTIDKTAVEGRKISLPCPLSAPSRDKVYMVLWFKNDVKIPIYSFDVRGKPLQLAHQWSAPEIFGSRAKFNTSTEPATLIIEDIRRHDEGIYRCRVDFRTSQTQSFRFNLSVIILPEYPVVLNRWGRPLNGTTIGPKEEGDDVLLTCRVIGGRPTPQVRWLVNGLIVDEQAEQQTGDLTENRLMWPQVQRSDLNSIFTCQAINTPFVDPRESSFVLDLHLKPLTVEILNKKLPLVADRRYEVQCESSGSKPNAIITWYKGKRQLRRAKEETLNNSTRSSLNFVPTTDDDGKSITCRAENPKVSGLFLETTWKIDVIYPPLVSLRLGSTLVVDDIKEGDDLYMECQIQSNPKFSKMYWMHDGVLISHNTTARVIRSNQNLVLQKITRNSSGNYSCSAVNAQGESISNPLILRVKYAPVCSIDKTFIVGAFRSENLNVVCEVHADPPPRSFKWKFNSSGETFELSKERHYKNGSRSILNYTPIMDQDYGTLTCIGQNEVGEQAIPCVFQIVLAALPSPVRNCSINNQTQHSLEIQCLGSYDGGIPQNFLLELIATRSGKLRLNLTNADEPFFIIDSLDTLTSFDSYGDDALRAVVYSVNQKGRSHGVLVKEFHFDNSVSNREVITNVALDFSPVLLGVLFTLVLLCIVIFVKVYCNRTSATMRDLNSDTKHMNNISYKHDAQQKHQLILKDSIKSSTETVEDEKDPDVIPQGKKTEKPLNSTSMFPVSSNYVSTFDEDATPSTNLNEWTSSSVNYYYNQFIQQNMRFKETSSLSTDSTLIASTPKSKSIAPNCHVEVTSSSYCGTNNTNPFHTPASTMKGNCELSTTAPSTASIDYDFNIQAIKTLLMTTKVPESCV